jgi:hypothetical protein
MYGKGAALVLPVVNTEAMQLHLEEISIHVARGSHGVVLTRRAGWHQTGQLNFPRNLTIILLPPRSAEPPSRLRGPTGATVTPQPVENLWQHLRQSSLPTASLLIIKPL